jgi:TRAP-type C4-dicarboxylate transport system permease small subunit
MVEKTLRILDKVLSFFESWTLFITVFIALIALFVNVVLRYGFNYSLAWSEELIRIVIVYTTLIGCSAAVKSGTMIKIDALVQIAPRLKIPLSYFSNLVTLIFSGMLVYYGWQIAAMQAKTCQKTVIMEIPYVLIYSFLPLMGVMMGIRTIQVLYRDITGRDIFKQEKGA